MELDVRNVNKFYDDFQALQDVSFCLKTGEIVGLLGHNGAGKSTLIKCMMNAIMSYDGEILIEGQDVRERQELISATCSFLLEPSFCEYLTAWENMALLEKITLFRSAYSIDEILSMVSLKRFADKKVAGFSFGMKQRLGLAQVLLACPKFVILDEPTVGLDPVGIDIIKAVIQKLSASGTAVLFSSHQLSDVFDICTRALVMNGGEIVYDGQSTGLVKKRYELILDREITSEQLFQGETEGLSVKGNTVFVEHAELLTSVLECVFRQKIGIVDLNAAESFEYLKTYMNTGGEKWGKVKSKCEKN